MRVIEAPARCVTYAEAPSGRTTTARGSRGTSMDQSFFADARSIADTWCVHAELTSAVFSSGVTAMPQASCGSATRAVSTSPAAGSGLRIRSRPEPVGDVGMRLSLEPSGGFAGGLPPSLRTVTSTQSCSGRTCAGRPGIGTSTTPAEDTPGGGLRTASNGRGIRRTTPWSSSAT